VRAQRRELSNQLEELEERRSSLSSRLQGEGAPTGADRAGVEARIREIDARILSVEQQLAAADAQVARAAALPGATVEPPPPPPDPVSEGMEMGFLLTGVLLLPIVLAYARRIWRRGAAFLPKPPSEVLERLTRLEQAVDTVAFEVERIGEGQRFLTHQLAESPRALDAAGQPTVDAPRREAVPVTRR
jgi:hypothetical protein